MIVGTGKRIILTDINEWGQDLWRMSTICYFDDMYSPEYTMQWICEAIQNHDIDAESLTLLDERHKEILQSECYEDYGVPSYIE